MPYDKTYLFYQFWFNPSSNYSYRDSDSETNSHDNLILLLQCESLKAPSLTNPPHTSQQISSPFLSQKIQDHITHRTPTLLVRTSNQNTPKQNTVMPTEVPHSRYHALPQLPRSYNAKTPPIQHLFGLPSSWVVPLVFRCAMLCSVTQSCPALCDPMDYKQPARLLCPWGFFRQECWSGLPCPPLGHLPNPGIEPRSPTLQGDSLLSEPPYWT